MSDLTEQTYALEGQLRAQGIEPMRHRGGWVIADLRRSQPRYRGTGVLWRSNIDDVNSAYRTKLQAVIAADEWLNPRTASVDGAPSVE